MAFPAFSSSHLGFGDTRRGWDFVSVGHGNVDFEAIVRELDAIGYGGPLSVEWEDSAIDRVHGAREAFSVVQRLSLRRPASSSTTRCEFD